MDLNSLVDSLPKGLHTVIGEKGIRISGGQRQRLAIARALYHEAEILLLDEITNQLDQKTESEVMLTLQKLTQQNKTIILVSHRPESWKLFDSVYELKNGKFHKVTVKDLETSY
jgi:ABC-type bacteriocin/lantibiotic exporter with double-glycine peptidase domain